MTLNEVKSIANRVRFSADKPKKDVQGRDAILYKDVLLRSGLSLHEDITPSLVTILERVCDRLGIPKTAVTAFVFADTDLQASCFISNPDECVLQFSSSLINLLGEEEMAFVMGHELGHFLLEHRGLCPNDLAPESFLKNRAQEISADRFGLIGCADINTALRALIKTISGLDDQFLRFDVGQFLSQVNQISTPSSGENSQNTHPSILIRARSLVWFSSSSVYETYPQINVYDEIKKIDTEVQRDLDKFIDAPLNKRIKTLKADIVMWLATQKILHDCVFDEAEKNKFRELFGDEMLRKFSSFINANGVNDTIALAQDNLIKARNELEALMPMNFAEDYEKICNKVEHSF